MKEKVGKENENFTCSGICQKHKVTIEIRLWSLIVMNLQVKMDGMKKKKMKMILSSRKAAT